MAESSSRQDEAIPVLRLATRAGKTGPARVPQENVLFLAIISPLLTLREVKMAGCWPYYGPRRGLGL